MQSSAGYFCYVVKADGTAERRAIEIGDVQGRHLPSSGAAVDGRRKAVVIAGQVSA